MDQNSLTAIVFGQIGLFVMPLPTVYQRSRTNLLYSLWEIFSAPFSQVNLWNTIVSDFLTSLAKPMADLYIAFYVIPSGNTH